MFSRIFYGASIRGQGSFCSLQLTESRRYDNDDDKVTVIVTVDLEFTRVCTQRTSFAHNFLQKRLLVIARTGWEEKSGSL